MDTYKYLYNSIFSEGKYFDDDTVDSVINHAMTHEDTENLGIFCDNTGLHGEDLKEVLIRGYLAFVAQRS